MKINWSRKLFVPVVGLLALLGACTPAPDLVLNLSGTSLTVNASQNGTLTITLTRTNLSDAVQLSLEKADGTALPTGISGTFTPNPAPANTSSLSVAVTGAVAVGNYDLRVKAVGGSVTKTKPLTLTVQAAPAFALSLASSPAAVVQGQNTSATVNIARTNFTGNVALSLEKADGTAAPAGITAAFDPNNTGTNSSGMTLSVAASVAPATYSLRVKGAGGSLSGTTTAFDLVVQAAPVAVTVRTFVNGNQQNVTLVAYQNGAGTWQAISGTGGSYTFDIAGAYGVAAVCSSNGQVNLYQFTTTETTNFRVNCGFGGLTSGPLQNLSGTVSGLNGAHPFGNINSSRNQFGATVATDTSPTYSVNFPRGQQTLYALRLASNAFGTVPDKLIFIRDFDLAANATRDFDFESSEAFALTGSYTVTGGETPNTVNYVVFGPNDFGGPILVGGSTYSAVPASQARPTDLYATSVGSSDFRRSSFVTFDTPQNLDIALPESLTATLTGTTARPQVSWSTVSGAKIYFITYGQANVAPWSVTISPGWLSGGNSYTLPDLSSVTGWQNAWELAAGASLNWNAMRMETNKSVAFSLSFANGYSTENIPEFQSQIRNFEGKMASASGSFGGVAPSRITPVTPYRWPWQ